MVTDEALVDDHGERVDDHEGFVVADETLGGVHEERVGANKACAGTHGTFVGTHAERVFRFPYAALAVYTSVHKPVIPAGNTRIQSHGGESMGWRSA